MGIQEGLALHSYINELPRRAEEAKLKAQLFKSQADHLNAQTGLLTLQQQQEQGFQSAMQQAFAQPPQGQAALPPDLANQPAGPNAGAPSIGTLHDTAAFADPDTQQLDKLSRVALATGTSVGMKHYAQLQQGRLEMQKVQQAQRTQQLQDMSAFYQRAYDGLPDVPENAKRRADLQQAQIAIQWQLGKSREALDLLGGKVVPLQAGGTLMRAPAQGGQAVPIGQSSTSLAQAEYDKTEGKNASEFATGRPGTAPAPRALAPRSMPRQPASTGAIPSGPIDTPLNDPLQLLQELENRGVPPEMIQQVAPHLLKNPAAAPVNESPVAKRARLAEEARIAAEGLQPGNPANTVPAQKERQQLEGQTGVKGATAGTLARQREAAQIEAQGLQPNNPAKSVQEQKDEIAQRTQALPSSEVDKLAPLLDVRSYLEELRTIPEAKMQQYVGLLRGPLAKVQQVVADTLEGPGKGDPDLHKFLSIINQIFYTTNRPETGANFSGVEKEMVNGIYATGTERSYTEFKAKLDRLDKTLETRIGNRTALTMSTRGNTGKVMEKPGESAATPAQETPQQLYDRKKKELGLQ